MSEPIVTASVAVGSAVAELIVSEERGEWIRGSVSVPRHGASLKFAWRRGKFPVPYVSDVVGQSGSLARAKDFARAVLDAWSARGVNHAGTGAAGSGDASYVSEEVVAAHCRRPCWVHEASGRRAHVRRGTVVNPGKLAPDDLQAAWSLVNVWNAAAARVADAGGFEVLSFAQERAA